MEHKYAKLTGEMQQEHKDLILKATNSTSLRVGAKIQTLWSGYGQIVRVHLGGEKALYPSVVVKHVKFPLSASKTDISHQRKVKSYQVETAWYKNYSTSQGCRTPLCLAAKAFGEERLIVLEDLDAVGFNQRRNSVSEAEMKSCLSWLAHFHALFMGVKPVGLWPVGTYWHLETRPHELEVMRDKKLKAAAKDIDTRLNECRFKTLVHGDAKLANFCFSAKGKAEVAAVDFQYVGGGCGMKDVAYLLGYCLSENQCEKKVPKLLDHYFSQLKLAMKSDVDFNSLELEWRAMFPLAWVDFQRFLVGWMPGHRTGKYSRLLTNKVLKQLKS